MYKICKNCRKRVTLDNALVINEYSFCDADCAVAYSQTGKAQKEAKKRERADLRSRKEALKNLSTWKKEAQKSVNAYVRSRDRNKTCASCDKVLQTSDGLGGYFDAGHFIPRGSGNPRGNALTFRTVQIWGQCKSCNDYKGGAYSEYRKKLITRIGLEKVEYLENYNYIDPLTKRPGVRKWTIPELKRIKDLFNRKRRLYEKKFR